MPTDLMLSQLTQMAFGYWNAQTLFAATAAGVFDHLAPGPATRDEIAAQAGLDPAAAERLLDAAVAARLLTRSDDGRYRNTVMADRMLTRTSAGSMVHWVNVMARWYEPWGHLLEAVRAGSAVESRGKRLWEEPEYIEDFILGMHEYNRRTAVDLARLCDLAGAQRLVDVGGGAGTYSIAACQVWPQLHAEIIDVEAVVPIARRVVADAGLSDRITVRQGDYYQDRFGTDVDAILLSNILHQESPEVSVDILDRARAALGPQGKLLVHGHVLAPSRTAPVFTTLHNLSALVLWDGGGSQTADELAALMKRAGLTSEVLQAPEPSARLIVGRRVSG